MDSSRCGTLKGGSRKKGWQEGKGVDWSEHSSWSTKEDFDYHKWNRGIVSWSYPMKEYGNKQRKGRGKGKGRGQGKGKGKGRGMQRETSREEGLLTESEECRECYRKLADELKVEEKIDG